MNCLFNYIITIHNKAELIEKVLLSVIRVAGSNSKIYCVLDGCTDDSENIVNKVIGQYPDFNIVKLFAPDVHELKAINLALQNSVQHGPGYNIILQDDVLLEDDKLEAHITKLYTTFPNLGIVSFRHGGNFSRSLLKKKKSIFPIKNYIESVYGHNPLPLTSLNEGFFTFREIAIKSPICIPFTLVTTIGIPDERYAPWNDLAYCFNATIAGFNNGVFAVKFRSDVSWGTTRKKEQKLPVKSVDDKNINLLKEQYSGEIASFKRQKPPDNKLYKIFEARTRTRYSWADYFHGFKSNVKLYCRHLIQTIFTA